MFVTSYEFSNPCDAAEFLADVRSVLSFDDAHGFIDSWDKCRVSIAYAGGDALEACDAMAIGCIVAHSQYV